MFRNIPNNYTREMLLELLDAEGFNKKYDFVYLPIDFHKGAGLGYGFVNLISEEEATNFMLHFNGFTKWVLKTSQKEGAVSWAEPLQGLKSYVDRYRNSPVMHADVPDSHRPLLFFLGERIPFPPPTKSIKAPRKKHVSQNVN